MNNDSLAHTKWDCKYHIVFIPKIAVSTFMGCLDMEIEIFDVGVIV